MINRPVFCPEPLLQKVPKSLRPTEPALEVQPRGGCAQCQPCVHGPWAVKKISPQLTQLYDTVHVYDEQAHQVTAECSQMYPGTIRHGVNRVIRALSLLIGLILN